MLMLHIGCGNVYFDGWVNLDVDSDKADIKHDLRNQLPFEDNTVDFIFSEHFIEHLTVNEGLRVMSDFYRVLKRNGVLRVATPDLDYLIFRYIFSWRKQDWINKYGYEWIKTRAEMINICFREWGHQYLYNREELERRLREVGFKKICKGRLNRSKYPELRNRETRKDSKLILEAEK